MNITKAEIQAVFTLWRKRVTETPEEFMSPDQIVELDTEEVAELSLDYFLKVLKEVRDA